MWTLQQSRERLQKSLDQCAQVDVMDLSSDISLDNLPVAKAYRVDAVHVYVDVLNAPELMASSKVESERTHRRYLRFLHLYQRAMHVVFQHTDAMKVDFQNERLHFIVYRPFDDEQLRVQTAVAIGNLISQLIKEANELHEELDDARVAVGIESGVCLAVRNGRRGDREPLFIGNAANHAAKMLGDKVGVFVGRDARRALGKTWSTDDTSKKLSEAELAECAAAADLKLSTATLLDRWKEDLATTPQETFNFHRPTPPLTSLKDLEELTPANAARIDAISMKADIDGFTKFVAKAVADRSGEAAAVRILHAARSEMRDVLADFDGRKVRYLGDCVEGVLAIGERVSDAGATVARSVACAGAMREAFGALLVLEPAAKGLGIAIGIDFGPVSIAALGVRGSRKVCSAGRAVLSAQAVQESCGGNETGIGKDALGKLAKPLADLFDDSGKAKDLTAVKVGLAAKLGGLPVRPLGLQQSAAPVEYARAHAVSRRG